MVCWELDQGRVLVDQGLALNPNLAACWQTSGSVRLATGEHETALEHLRRALRVNPIGTDAIHIENAMAGAYLFQGNYEQAIHWANRVAMRVPSNPLALLTTMSAHALAGQVEEARRVAVQFTRSAPKWTVAYHRDTFPLCPSDRQKNDEALRLAGFPE